MVRVCLACFAHFVTIGPVLMTSSSPTLAEPGRTDRLNRVRTLAIVALVALIVLCLAWELFLAPVRPGGSWLALKALPLCLPLAGLLKHRMYTYRWLSLMIWLYFLEGMVRATSDRAPSLYYAWAEAALSLVLFIACSVYVKYRFKT